MRIRLFPAAVQRAESVTAGGFDIAPSRPDRTHQREWAIKGAFFRAAPWTSKLTRRARGSAYARSLRLAVGTNLSNVPNVHGRMPEN
jgi:hypothetical protein